MFKSFISRYGIKFLDDGTKVKYKYKFSKDSFTSKTYRWNYCNTLNEFFEYCSELMLEGVCNNILELSLMDLLIIKYLPKDYIHLDRVNSLSIHKDIYEYLKNIDSAKANLPLEYLYLLLYHDVIDSFKS